MRTMTGKDHKMICDKNGKGSASKCEQNVEVLPKHAVYTIKTLSICINHIRASGRSRKKSQNSRDFQGQIRGKKADFAGISREFWRPISLKNDR